MRFKEADANWLFFYAIAHRFKSPPSSDDRTGKITVKL